MPRARRRTAAAGTAIKLAELGLAAPLVVAHRLTRMGQAGASPNARDRREFTTMALEKPMVFAQAWLAMCLEGLRWQQQLALWWLAGAPPRGHAARTRRAVTRVLGSGLTPVHAKAMANARRLSRTRALAAAARRAPGAPATWG